MPLIVPPNLIGRDAFVFNGAFNQGDAGWEGSGATINPVSTPRLYSVGAVSVTVDGGNVGIRQTTEKAFAVTPGVSYLADIACRAHADDPSMPVHLQAAQYTAGDVFISAPDSGELVLDPDEWRLAAVSFIAASTAAYVRLHGITWGEQTGIFYIGGARIRPADR